MDRLAYHEVIVCLLEEYRAWYCEAIPPQPSVETLIIKDEERGYYQLMHVGWRESKRVCRLIFFLRLKNGKIWIEEDWTEESIADELLAKGVPNEDIVLAFNPPEVRHLTEFAVA